MRKLARMAVSSPMAGGELGVCILEGMLAMPSARAKGRVMSPTDIPADISCVQEKGTRLVKTSMSFGFKKQT